MKEAILSILLTLSLIVLSNYRSHTAFKETSSLSTTKEIHFQQELDLLVPLKHKYYSSMEHLTTITISFAGDCTIGYDNSFSYENSFPHVLEKNNNNYGYFFEKVRSIFLNDDLTIVNLETTLTNATKKANKKFRFKGEPEYVRILTEGGVEGVNIANNHIYDYLHEGFEDTLKSLESASVNYSGEGKIALYDIKGHKIVSLGYCGWNTSIEDVIESDIRIAKEFSDLIVVSLHWGQERMNYPNSTQTQLGRLAIDIGADVVIGHHPHVIQGIELYKDKYIVYSLGNFSFGGNKNPSDKDSFIFQNEFQFFGRKLLKNKGKIIPVQISSTKSINDYQPIILKDKEKKRVLERINEYSKPLEYGVKLNY